jgi:hypothetical protein
MPPERVHLSRCSCLAAILALAMRGLGCRGESDAQLGSPANKDEQDPQRVTLASPCYAMPGNPGIHPTSDVLPEPHLRVTPPRSAALRAEMRWSQVNSPALSRRYPASNTSFRKEKCECLLHYVDRSIPRYPLGVTSSRLLHDALRGRLALSISEIAKSAIAEFFIPPEGGRSSAVEVSMSLGLRRRLPSSLRVERGAPGVLA